MPSRRLALPAALAAVAIFSACTSPVETPPTPTPIRSANAQLLQRLTGIFPVSENRLLWVTGSDEILIDSADIQAAHPFTLAGQSVVFTAAESGSEVSSGAVISDDESVIAIPLRTSSGDGGVALVRSDGYNMAVHLYGDSTVTVSSIKFMPEVGLTLLSLGGASGSRVTAINNYGLMQFELPVSDSLGKIRYSPDELRYMVIDRRPLEEELELIPFEEPGESTLFRPSDSSEEETRLYRSLSAAIASWE